MFLDNDKLLFDAAMEGAYTGYLDYPVFVSEDEVTQYARQYAQDIALETNADFNEVLQNGWAAGYLLVCEFAEENPEAYSRASERDCIVFTFKSTPISHILA